MRNGQTFPYRLGALLTDGATEKGSRARFWTSA